MRKTIKRKWRADRGTRAAKAVSQIGAEIAGLNDEDLLDLHDIFAVSAVSALAVLAADEMRRRNISA